MCLAIVFAWRMLSRSCSRLRLIRDRASPVAAFLVQIGGFGLPFCPCACACACPCLRGLACDAVWNELKALGTTLILPLLIALLCANEAWPLPPLLKPRRFPAFLTILVASMLLLA
jgi:hypothetical protein